MCATNRVSGAGTVAGDMADASVLLTVQRQFRAVEIHLSS